MEQTKTKHKQCKKTTTRRNKPEYPEQFKPENKTQQKKKERKVNG